MLRFAVERRAATADEVDAALARLDDGSGLYFGCDAGVAGLHPLQATLLSEPAVVFQLFEDGVDVEALDAYGAALLADPAFAEFHAACGRGNGSPVGALRAFLAGFDAHPRDASGSADDDVAADAPNAEVLLLGALRFESHRLAESASRLAAPASAALGVFFFAPALLRRDAAGRWRHVLLRFDSPALAVLGAERERAPATRSSRSGSVPDAGLAAAEPRDDFPPGGYAAVVARAVERLAQQPLVSLTLSQSFRRRVGAASAAAAFARLRRVNPAPATFFVNTGRGERVFGASPDLQLRIVGRDVESFPVCGTVARGHGPVGEAEAVRQLINEEVDAASLAVCTDALRNDLAPLCEPGSLRLHDRRRPMALATVVHAVDRFGGRLRDGVDAWDAIVATAAPAMVTGTPRRLALAAIGELEAGPRGWYGGMVVQVAANGDALVGTMLRAAAIRAGIAEVRTGGDLLADSDPSREEHESRVKAVSLWRALGLSVADELETAIAGGAGGAAAPMARRAASSPEQVSLGALPSAVALRDGGDPFAAAVVDALLTCGVRLDEAARPLVLIGNAAATGAAERLPETGVVAIGDAAARVLAQAGWAVRPSRPEHGRLVRCHATAAAPSAVQGPGFVAMRYATLTLGAAPAGKGADDAVWEVWIRDDADTPLVLADVRRRIICLLIRPESLLSDPAALQVLKTALAVAATARA